MSVWQTPRSTGVVQTSTGGAPDASRVRSRYLIWNIERRQHIRSELLGVRINAYDKGEVHTGASTGVLEAPPAPYIHQKDAVLEPVPSASRSVTLAGIPLQLPAQREPSWYRHARAVRESALRAPQV